ncbi:MAG: sugar hydrolase [Blautia sp.]|nr:sugar hydrolase [Blautia sp.]
MAAVSIMDEFEVHKNEKFLEIAESLRPKLRSRFQPPQKIVEIARTKFGECKVVKERAAAVLQDMTFRKGDKVCLDFGDHMVGYVSLELASKGSHQDAPVFLHLKFGEIPQEIEDKSEDYHGWISRSWIQEEYVHIDVLPAKLELPRRYAFRYMEIEVIDVSLKFSLQIKNAACKAVSAVNFHDVDPINTGDVMLNEMDRISVRTLQECMQDVFEDGPKRDQRLWLGDLRLQARANYVSFKNYDLAKRCLYLFAGMPFNEGKISACVFTEPEPAPDDTYLMDYALLFGAALYDYYEATKDMDTLVDLYPTAIRQIEIVIDNLNADHVVEDPGDAFVCFIDWGEGLNKQCSAQGVLIYSMRYGMRLAKVLGDEKTCQWLEKESELCKKAAVDTFWDKDQQLFISGEEKQISWASQIWMILARVFDVDMSHELIMRTMSINPRIRMVTPYMYHHFIDALIRCGEEERALDEMKRYWGEMIRDGADTFWELYNPYNKNESPYGSSIVNSYCHAWSCTPTYLLRKFFAEKKGWMI